MGDYKTLIVWQVANELRRETLLLLRRPVFAQDWALRKEGRKTLGQICRRIPEGYKRHTHAEFAQFLQYSLGSVGELRDFFDEVQERKFLTARDLHGPRQLCYRLDVALTRFIHYLRRNDPPPSWV